ncbi:MAG: hypothetical protein M1828_005393 [Chrysothrix sp. TS-e1954]|nr:MAG: hypothetical protein M1828_005393 [Chrysothrix sp. TS-e1954]
MALERTVNTSIFNERAGQDLLGVLDSLPGKKNVVLQQSLVGPVELVVKFPTLQEHGVDRIFYLENGNLDSSQRHVVFFARGQKPKQVQAVAAQIKRLQQDGNTNHDFTVCWVPRRTLLSDNILEESGVLGEVNVTELNLYFQSLESDLLSLELDNAFGDLYLRRDPTCIFTAAKALMEIQLQHGLFPCILGKGEHARQLKDIILRMRTERSATSSVIGNGVPKTSSIPSSTIDSLIIIDRQVDFPSALLTQLTYEGLIDENFTIKHNQVELDSSIVGSAPQQQQGQATNTSTDHSITQPAPMLKRKVRLDSGTDPLYASLRDANFAIVGNILNKVARRLQTDYEGRHASQTTAELSAFVKKLPGYQQEQQSLKIHTGLVEELLKRTRAETFGSMLEVQQNLAAGAEPSTLHPTIEDLIAREVPISIVLRLLCLESCVSNGLRPKDFDYFRRLVLQAYGFEHLLTISALEKMKLLQVRSGGGAASAFSIPGASSLAATATGQSQASRESTNYTGVRRSMRLVLDDVSEQDPQDVAYVYSGFAPLSVRIIQSALHQDFSKTTRSASGTNKVNTVTSGTVPAMAKDSSPSWKGFEGILSNVAGPTFSAEQTVDTKSVKAKNVLEARGAGAGRDGRPGLISKKTTTVVFFLGGITYAEVAALRFLASRDEVGRDILITTTGIIGGNRMMDAAMAEAKEHTK